MHLILLTLHVLKSFRISRPQNPRKVATQRGQLVKKQPFEPNPQYLSMFQSIALVNEPTLITTSTEILPWLQKILRLFLSLCSRLRADGEPRRSTRRSDSRSVLHGLAPDLDSDYSNDQATLPLRSARPEVDVRCAGVSMDLGPTRQCMWPRCPAASWRFSVHTSRIGPRFGLRLLQ